MKYLIISCSLNPQSKSRILAKHVHQQIKDSEFIDLQEYPLPLCDGNAAYGDKNTQFLAQKIAEADGIILAVPIYNFDVNSAAKNLIELTGDGWENKVAGFLCAAGGNSSYMSVMSFANSLMLDFRTVILPRFVYASKGAISGSEISDTDVKERLDSFAKEFVKLTNAVRGE